MPTTDAPRLGQCRVCGRPWPLAPGGLLVRHPRDQHPVFAKNCDGGRKPPEKETA